MTEARVMSDVIYISNKGLRRLLKITISVHPSHNWTKTD